MKIYQQPRLVDLGSMTQVTQKEGSLVDSENWAPAPPPDGRPTPESD